MTASVNTARKLRRNGTDAEKVFWRHVRNRQQNYKFYRQMPIQDYVADFACPELKLVIEIGGGQHHGNTADDERTKVLALAGYKVIRFWNNDVLANSEGVIARMNEEIELRLTEMKQPWV